MSYTHFGQLGQRCKKSYAPLCIEKNIQLNKYKTDPYYLQIFQSNMSVCLIISMFCKSCEPICEPKIVLKNFAGDFKGNPTDISCKNTFTFSVQFTNLTIRRNKHCHAFEILKKIWTCLALNLLYIPAFGCSIRLLLGDPLQRCTSQDERVLNLLLNR